MGSKFISYTNGIINKRFKHGDKIPDGFYPGVTMSERKKREIAEKRKQTMIERYGVENPMHSEELKGKLQETNLRKYGNVCSLQGEDVKEKTKKTCLERYGTEYAFQSEIVKDKIKETNLERYGVENPYQSEEIKEKIKQINRERLGVDYPMQSEEVQLKSIQTSLEKYGTEHPNQSGIVKRRITESNLRIYGTERASQSDIVKEKARETNLKRYGGISSTKSQKVLEKIKETNLERYGVEWTCMRPEARKYSNDSLPNRTFAKVLEKNNISYVREFYIESYSFDFKVGNILIEVDPSVTHNLIWYPFGNHESRITKDYHQKKTNKAIEAGYQCIHIFDWDDIDKIICLLQVRETLYARECEIREASIDDIAEFLNKYHLQGFCKGQNIRLGMYYNNELVSIMTFGKPRYNKNYEYELLRYCSNKNVIGGANKLFKYFVNRYNPKSIISYCDNSKFRGDVYSKLGFVLKDYGSPSCHWYSEKEGRHITDNLLRQRGYDQLFNESYGKGTSNEELIIQRGYLPVYDCGQSVWVYED